MRCLLATSLLFTASAASPYSWIDDPAVRRDAEARKPVTPPVFTVNLDLPASQRWNSVYSDPLFRNAAADVHGYLANNVPKWTVPILEGIAKHLPENFHDYGDEMAGVAKATNMSLGDVVLVNLVYALENIVNTDCAESNTTGPCKNDSAVAEAARRGPGACTSFVAEDSHGVVWHGRNLDWNLPAQLRKYAFDVSFQRAGKELYRATTIAGLVGAIHGQRPGGFTVSLDARNKGGNSLADLLDFLLKRKARTATHLLREALETQADFDAGVRVLANTSVVQPVYFIVGGAKSGQGAVVARDRSAPARDVWLLNNTAEHPPWFMLQTNYDHWEQPPKWDDRRHPGIAHLQALGQAGVGEAGVTRVLRQWPTMNNHTDVSAVMSAAKSIYSSTVWMDAAAQPVLVV